jgi:hypothetical protein
LPISAGNEVPGRCVCATELRLLSTVARCSIALGDEEVTLWKLERQERIPQREARFMLNLWHSRRHWLGGTEADYPARNCVMRVDWFRYRPGTGSAGQVP